MIADRPAHPPSVETLLAAVRPRRPAGQDHAALVDAARGVLGEERARIDAGGRPRSVADLADDTAGRLAAWTGAPSLEAINATGVIVHTNLGRAPWPAEAVEAAIAASRSLFLELDRSTGRRGARFRTAEEHLIAVTGAEDALVTNNNAAGLALAVGLAGRGRGVAVSRGELVEIGGGVRIPEIVRRAGAKLVEVGTTNRTRAADYEEPLVRGGASVVLRVHPSNFAQTGFVERPDARELADLAHRHAALVIDDLGSGALLPTEAFGLAHEPTPRERLADGADLVPFRGDTLVGGPQAGFVVGRADLVARLRRDPLARAMRPDKVTLAAVAATLGLYRAGVAADRVPVWRMIGTPVDVLRERAAAVLARLPGRGLESIELEATVGGGSLPGETLASVGIAIPGRAEARLARLRTGTPAVIGRVESGRAVLDLRTVDPRDDDGLGAAIEAALAG